MTFWSFMGLMLVVSTVASIVRGALGIPRFRASRRHWQRLGFDSGEDIARLDAALADRDTVIEELQHRLSEMESRLDFAERLLTERSQTPAGH